VDLLSRCLRSIHPGRNPLVRRSDRIQARLLLAVVAGILLTAGVAASLGSTSYQRHLAAADEEVANRHPATAVLLTDAQRPITVNDGTPTASLPIRVPARWELPNGVERVGQVAVSYQADRGSEVAIWLNGDGDPVPRPTQPSDAVLAGVLVGIFSWLAVSGALIGLYLLSVRVLDSGRAAQWERDWAAVSERWTSF
jgi:hypothetical protein